MGYPTKVQLIQRQDSQQWYINFPAALAQAMGFNKGETVQWSIVDQGRLVLTREPGPPPAPAALKKTRASSSRKSKT